MPRFPKVDNRLIRIFLSLVVFRDFMPHTRCCPLGAKHKPRVDAGQDINNLQRLFVVHEDCRGIAGWRCDGHGKLYSKQLTEKQRAAAIAQVVQLEPFPYDYEPLLDWCINYMLSRQRPLVPENAVLDPPPPKQANSAPAVAMRPLQALPAPTSHKVRHRCWVSSLIPANSSHNGARGTRGPSRVIASARPSSLISLSAPVTTLARVYCYVQNGRHPELVEVDANHQETMTYVNLRHPDILRAFGLKPRARSLPERIQVYDIYGDKWYHPAAVSLWLRLHADEVLILRASTITHTPGLEDYTLKTFTRRPRPGVDALRGFLALSRSPANRPVPFSPVPPLTVMLAQVPEHDGALSAPTASTSPTIARTSSTAGRAVPRAAAPSSSRPPVLDRSHGAKHHKCNDGSSGVLSNDIIELTSDEEDSVSVSNPHKQRTPPEVDGPPPATQRPRKRLLHHNARNTVTIKNSSTTKEVIVISDDDEPVAGSSTRTANSSTSRPTTAFKSAMASKQLHCAPADAGVANGDQSAHRSVSAQPRTFSGIHALSAGLRASASGGLTCFSFTVVRNHGDKGKRRATDAKDHDSGADSDETLC